MNMHLMIPADRNSAIEALKEMVNTETLAKYDNTAVTMATFASANLERQDLPGSPPAKLPKVALTASAFFRSFLN
jgi:hypothetical protein